MLARRSLVPLIAVAIIAIDAGAAWAQQGADSWPAFPAPFSRGPGFYLDAKKIGFYWALFALWVYTTDWLSRDTLRMKQNSVLWNSVTVGSFLATFMLMFLVPWFWFGGYFLLLVSYAAPLITYIVLRNKAVEVQERVLTRPHLRRVLSRLATKLGLSFAAEKVDARDVGPEVKFTPQGAVERDNSANLLTARNLPGYVVGREIVHEAVKRRADGILLDFGRQNVSVRHQIDGVWTAGPNREREKAEPSLAVFKTLAGIKPEDPRPKGAGKFGIETAGQKFDCNFSSQRAEMGERAMMLLENKKLKFNSLEEIGMRPKLIEQLTEVLRNKKGFVIISSLPGGGLSTLFDVTLNATDRFVRNFVAVEDAAKAERDVLNIGVTTYNSKAGESPATVLPPLIRQYPDVFVVRDMVNAETATILCGQVNSEDRLVFSSARAKEAPEALLRILLLKMPPADFATAVTAAINGRLLRKLCEKCKEAYAPPAEVIKQFGLPQKLPPFHRPPTKPIDPKHPEKKCEACGGVGYLGRTGFYELLIVDDAMRRILVKQPKLELLRDAARKAKQRSLLEEGILLVAKGVTSLDELIRVMKV